MKIWINRKRDENDAPREPMQLTDIEDQCSLLRLAQVDYHLDRRPFDIHVGRYSERSWAIWVNGELLAVTAYRKGAEQIKALVEEMMAMLMAGDEGQPEDLQAG